MKYNGVGPKIANLFTQIAYNKTNGIAVDTHVHRIPNRLKWFETDTPIQSKKLLEKLFKKDEWKNLNGVLVGFGQNICDARKPKCDQCPIVHLCKADENFMIRKAKRLKKNKKKEDKGE